MKLQISAFGYLIVAMLPLSVYCLNCYQCDSNTNPDCTEFFDHDHEDTLTIRRTECSVDASEFCIKTTGVWGGVVGTTRFCSSRDMGNQCQFIRYPDHDRVYRACIYTCTSDGCNGASSVTLSVTQVLLPLLCAVFLLTTCKHYLS